MVGSGDDILVGGASYFAYSATLRIFGDGLPFEEFEGVFGVQPTNARRKGERRGPRSPSYREDAWCFEAALDEGEPLGRHLDALWEVFGGHVDYLKGLKSRFRVDVFCGYRTDCGHAGFEVPHTSLRLHMALEVPFGVSVIVA